MRTVIRLIPLLLFFYSALVVTRLSGQSMKSRPETQDEERRSGAGQAEAGSAVLPVGTSLQVALLHDVPMRAGVGLDGELLYPIYCDGRIALAAHTRVHGHVLHLSSDTGMRWRGRLRGDFTPFHVATVQFDSIEVEKDSFVIEAAPASEGAPVLHLSTPGASPKRSFVSRQMAAFKEQVRSEVELFTAPGRKDRAMRLLYRQLPYHPERIVAKTAWNFELTKPLHVTANDIPRPVLGATTQSNSETWLLRATLDEPLTSGTARVGDAVEASVVEPIFDRDRQQVVPQGSRLIGRVTYAKAARSFGRNGKLRFTFQSIQFPEGSSTQVDGALAGASTEKTQNLKLDAEGTVSPRNQSSVIAPLVLTLLAGRALDQDGNLTAQTGVASNGFGVVGRIVGIAAQDRNIAAGIGFYAAGLSVYENFLKPGHDVIFGKDTRIEIETTPLRAPVLKPAF